MKSLFLTVFIFLSGVLTDQALKLWIRNHFSVGESPGYPIPGIFEITLTYNEGVAFGAFQGFGYLFTPFALLVTLYIFFYSYQHRNLHKGYYVALGLIASGAIGNMIDRVWLGKVTDMFWFRLINYPVFNLADAYICVGVGLMFLMQFLNGKKTCINEC